MPPVSVMVNTIASDDRLGGSHLPLSVGQQLSSPNSVNRVTLQSDGNLVVHNNSTNTPLFSSLTKGTPKVHVLTLASGKVELTRSAGKVVWVPKAKAGVATSLVLKNHGDLQLLDSSSAVLWTGTLPTAAGKHAGAGSRCLHRPEFDSTSPIGPCPNRLIDHQKAQMPLLCCCVNSVSSRDGPG